MIRPQRASIGPQEDPRLELFLGRALAFPDQLVEPFPFLQSRRSNCPGFIGIGARVPASSCLDASSRQTSGQSPSRGRL